jgi:hypothetical protein
MLFSRRFSAQILPILWIGAVLAGYLHGIADRVARYLHR